MAAEQNSLSLEKIFCSRFEQALAGFEGSILTVVHDRFFIQRYATRIWEIRQGELLSFEKDAF
jgi:ATPase subunit of ABC transporter with duplicated ATPase domains